MRQFYLVAIVSTLFFSITSCSSSNTLPAGNEYRIDYYSGGGFTGIESGLTILSSGTVKFWKRNPNSERRITDSLQLTEIQLKRLDDLIINPELFTYTYKFSGNYTTHLVLSKDIQSNQISFNSSDLPEEMPGSVKDLISEIKTIFNK
jgi:hypothetical protein